MLEPSRKRRSGGKRTAQSHPAPPPSSPPTPAAESGRRTERVATPLSANVARVVAERSSGYVRRKNLNVDQGLLDQVRTRLGLRTETEAVEMGLGALLELAEFETAMLEGFDHLMATGGLRPVEDEELDLSGFTTSDPTDVAD